MSFSDGNKMIQCGALKLLFVESLEKPFHGNRLSTNVRRSIYSGRNTDIDTKI